MQPLRPSRICVVLEANAEMKACWQQLQKVYLERILRSCCQDAELALIVFWSRGVQSEALLESEGWTSDVCDMKQWLDEVVMLGGGRLGCSALPEALAEATYMFQQPGMGLPPEQYAKHILLFSMTAAHEVPVPWPASASHDLGPMTPLGLEMMDALTKQDITFSVLSAAQLGNRRWLQALRTYFLQAEEGLTRQLAHLQSQSQQHAQHALALKQLQQKAGAVLEACMCPLADGHLALFSHRWPAAWELLGPLYQSHKSQRQQQQYQQQQQAADAQAVQPGLGQAPAGAHAGVQAHAAVQRGPPGRPVPEQAGQEDQQPYHAASVAQGQLQAVHRHEMERPGGAQAAAGQQQLQTSTASGASPQSWQQPSPSPSPQAFRQHTLHKHPQQPHLAQLHPPAQHRPHQQTQVSAASITLVRPQQQPLQQYPTSPPAQRHPTPHPVQRQPTPPPAYRQPTPPGLQQLSQEQSHLGAALAVPGQKRPFTTPLQAAQEYIKEVNRKNTAQHAAEREELAARHAQRAAGPRTLSSQAELHAFQQQQQQQQAHQASLASLGTQQAMAAQALRLQPAHQQAALQHAPRSVGLPDAAAVSHVGHAQRQQTPPLQLGRGPGYQQLGASGAQGLQPVPMHMQMPGMGHPAEVWQGTVFAIPKLLGRGHDSQVGVHVLTARLIASQDPKRGMWPPKHSLGEPLRFIKFVTKRITAEHWGEALLQAAPAGTLEVDEVTAEGKVFISNIHKLDAAVLAQVLSDNPGGFLMMFKDSQVNSHTLTVMLLPPLNKQTRS